MFGGPNTIYQSNTYTVQLSNMGYAPLLYSLNKLYKINAALQKLYRVKVLFKTHPEEWHLFILCVLIYYIWFPWNVITLLKTSHNIIWGINVIHFVYDIIYVEPFINRESVCRVSANNVWMKWDEWTHLWTHLVNYITCRNSKMF